MGRSRKNVKSSGQKRRRKERERTERERGREGIGKVKERNGEQEM